MRIDTPSHPMTPRRDAAAAGSEPPDFGRLLASMSHELRTPLAAILGYADLLLLGLPHPLPDESKAQVDRMRRAARHLQQLLDEILTFARVEASQEPVHRVTVALNAIVRETGAQLERLVAGRPVRIVVSLPDGPVFATTDVAKLGLVLSHLGAHAVARTERGTVTLAGRDEEEGVVLEVRDTGAGIPAERLAHVFEPSWQGGPEGAAGTGLGLPLAAVLTRLLGGEISVKSREGIGSTFTVRLPRG